MKIFLTLLNICFLALLLLSGCAAEKPPGGGPPDTEPPVLQYASLQEAAVNVAPSHILHFAFSEPLDPRRSARSIVLFPLNATPADIRVRGRNIFIKPLEPWDPGTVYSLILGKDIADYRGNSLPAPLQYGFTTGETMPRNRICGRLRNIKENNTCFIYLSRHFRDPDSIFAHPEYYTQAASGGEFAFYHLPRDTFYIAGFQDLDKSNSYKERFDGSCVPSRSFVIPDTLEDVSVELLALETNFLPPALLKVNSLYPGATELLFSKAPAPWNPERIFRIGSAGIDTILYGEKSCTLYHERLRNDSVQIRLRDLYGRLSCVLKDTAAVFGVSPLADTAYTFIPEDTLLFVAPPPGAAVLTGRFEASRDTFDLTLDRLSHGIYRIPPAPSTLRGTWHVTMPASPEYPEVPADSVYRVEIEYRERPEYGAVLGDIHTPAGDVPMRMRLADGGRRYETAVQNGSFVFRKVLPGNYTLYAYADFNGNGRQDPGRPWPYRRPEIPYEVDTNIQVRARWDTELEGRYEIEIDNGS